MMLFIGLLAALLGFFISFHIYRKKESPAPLVCPLKGNCDTVVRGRFSTTLGVRNEILGVGYFSLVALLYGIEIFLPSGVHPGVTVLLFVASTIGFFFSAYLTAVQGLVLRSWCTWCLFSAAASAVLFGLLFFRDASAMISFLGHYRGALLGVHTIGFVLGLGAATITDILFFRFLKDHRISQEEKGALDTLTSVIWVGLTLLVLSGVGLYLPEAQSLNDSAKFLLKVVTVGVVVVNGFLLNFKVAPYLVQVSFDRAPAPTRLRRLAFSLGAISITSWYLAFFLGMARTVAVSFEVGLVVYGGLLLSAVVGSQLIERSMISRPSQPSPSS